MIVCAAGRTEGASTERWVKFGSLPPFAVAPALRADVLHGKNNRRDRQQLAPVSGLPPQKTTLPYPAIACLKPVRLRTFYQAHPAKRPCRSSDNQVGNKRTKEILRE